jgi:hypothetical protein
VGGQAKDGNYEDIINDNVLIPIGIVAKEIVARPRPIIPKVRFFASS